MRKEYETMSLGDRLVLWGLAAMLGVFWLAVAYAISHWRGAPFSPWALAVVFVVTTALALLLFALLRASKD